MLEILHLKAKRTIFKGAGGNIERTQVQLALGKTKRSSSYNFVSKIVSFTMFLERTQMKKSSQTRIQNPHAQQGNQESL